MKVEPIAESAAIANPDPPDGGPATPWGSDALWSELTQGSGWFGPGASKETGTAPDPFITPSGTT